MSTQPFCVILSETGRRPRVFRDDHNLTETVGLDSLDLAQAVVSLDRELGADPFRVGVPRVRTFGEFVTLYQRALGGET